MVDGIADATTIDLASLKLFEGLPFAPLSAGSFD